MTRGLRQWLAEKRQRDAAVASFEEQLPELPDGLSQQIYTVETAALHLYAQNGLPTEAGSYLQRGPDREWEKLPDSLTPTEKWELYNEAPPNAGWRFCERAHLGRGHPIAEVDRASRLLIACSELKARLDGRLPTQPKDVEAALHLGAAAALLTGALNTAPYVETVPHQPLIFMAVEEDQTPPDPTPPKAKPPRPRAAKSGPARRGPKSGS